MVEIAAVCNSIFNVCIITANWTFEIFEREFCMNFPIWMDFIHWKFYRITKKFFIFVCIVFFLVPFCVCPPLLNRILSLSTWIGMLSMNLLQRIFCYNLPLRLHEWILSKFISAYIKSTGTFGISVYMWPPLSCQSYIMNYVFLCIAKKNITTNQKKKIPTSKSTYYCTWPRECHSGTHRHATTTAIRFWTKSKLSQWQQ